MAAKIGLRGNEPGDDDLITELLDIMSAVETDMTIFYRCLADISMEENENRNQLEPFMGSYYKEETLTLEYQSRFAAWLSSYRSRLRLNNLGDRQRKEQMNGINPKYVFRNYLAQQAIDKAEHGDFSMIEELMDVLRKPYDEQPDKEGFAARRPEWARNKPGCSMLSCSS
jgi:uncharacterized protein YdiU (UPF0061 family)